MSKTFIETVLSIHERIQKSRALGTKKQVPSSCICKYNLLRKADTLDFCGCNWGVENVYDTEKKEQMYFIN